MYLTFSARKRGEGKIYGILDFQVQCKVYTKKKPNPNNQKVKFETIEEGICVQMLHVGPYSEEGKTFEVMERYCSERRLSRKTFSHREIYLSDGRKVAPEKMKTTLRYPVK